MQKFSRQPNHESLDIAAIIAKRYRLSLAHARVVAELSGIGKHHTELQVSTKTGGAQ